MAEQTKKSAQFSFGQRVRFSHVLERKGVVVTDAKWGGGNQKHWLPCERSGEGIVIGYRTLSNGYTTYDREDGNTWNPVGHRRAAIVAFSLYRKPVFVPLDSLASLENADSPALSGPRD